MQFSLNLNNRVHIGQKDFKQINWLPINNHFKQIISSMLFKFCNNTSPPYMNDVFNLLSASVALIQKPVNWFAVHKSTDWGLYEGNTGTLWVKPAGQPNTTTRTSLLKLNQPLQRTNHSQKNISYIGPIIWNNLPNSLHLKITDNLKEHQQKNFCHA